eukprot:s1099_g16.t1
MSCEERLAAIGAAGTSSADACFLCPRNQLIAATEALISAGCGVCLAGTDFFKITGKPVRALAHRLLYSFLFSAAPRFANGHICMNTGTMAVDNALTWTSFKESRFQAHSDPK